MTPFLKSARQILKNFKKGSRITRTSTHFFTDRLLLFVVIFGLTSLGFSKNGKAQETSNYNSIYYYVGANASIFMDEPNSDIINNLKAFRCNSIFLFMKTLADGIEPNAQNLGLMQCSPSASYSTGYQGMNAYRDKVTDFIHQASSTTPPIKVFGLLVETEDFINEDNTDPTTRKLKNIAKYQYFARYTFPNKFCLLNGIVTNIEPWDIPSDNRINIGGEELFWKEPFCHASKRINNEKIMNYYLSFISSMRETLVDEYYYYPLQPPSNPQIVDDVFMGTTHWYLHYFSERYSEFPSGNFSHLIGSGKFDIILPQTYCGKKGDCLSLPCINSQLTSFCEFIDHFDDDSDIGTFTDELAYNESAGSCFEWFEKHYVTDFMYQDPDVTPPPYTIPVDAAPMLYGHTAAHDENTTLTQVNVINTRHLASRITSCYNKPYRGSVIFDYDRMKNLPTGNLNSLITFDCDDYLKPPNPTELIDGSNNLFSIKPNPAINTLYVDGLDGTQTVLIYNFMNEKLVESRVSPIDVSKLTQGFYALTIVDAGSNLLYRQTISINR